MIPGGYYIKARKIKESVIAHAPPATREIWDYLMREANHSGKKKHGLSLERGQVFTSYGEIRDDLSWWIGYRKQQYTKAQCENAMKLLRRESMATTTKTTRGIIVTISNYSYYQNPKNYEQASGDDNGDCNAPQGCSTIDKNGKNERINTEEPIGSLSAASPPDDPPKPKTPSCPQQKIISIYHDKCPMLPSIQSWDATAEKWLRSRWREDDTRQCLEWWSEFFEYVTKGPWLVGNNKSGWVADLRWIVKPANFTKILNGNYHNNKSFHDKLINRRQAWLDRQKKREMSVS